MFVHLTNHSGHTIRTKVGFSWTVLFFGFFVPLFRKDWKWFLIMFAIDVIFSYLVGGLGDFGDALGYVINIWLAFFYNEIYIKSLLQNGYVALNRTDKRVLTEKGLYNNL